MEYAKINIKNRSNGSNVCNAILTKNDVGALVVIGKPNTAPFLRGPQVPSIMIRDVIFTAHGGLVGNVIRAETNQMDSIETCLIRERLDTNSVFANYCVRIIGTPLTALPPFSVNIDDLFIPEFREAHVSRGLLIKEAYSQDNIYSGFHRYHHSSTSFNRPLQQDKPWRIGVELEVYANDQDAYNKITESRTNWFQCESDGSLHEREFPIEIKTIPLRACDAKSPEFWEEPMTRLAQLAKSKNFTSTGLHIHISKEIFGDDEITQQNNISKLCCFYTYYIEDDPEAHRKNVILCGRENCYGTGSLTETKNHIADFLKKEMGASMIGKDETIFKEISDDVKAKYRNLRWDVNLKHLNDYGTVEFRKGSGSISRNRLAALCTWWEQMCIYCNETNPKDFSFERFFNKVCAENPVVAYFFNLDTEA